MKSEREKDFTTLFESLSHGERREFVKDAIKDTISFSDQSNDDDDADREDEGDLDADDIVDEVKNELLDDLEHMIEEKMKDLQGSSDVEDVDVNGDIDSVLDESLELENLKKRRELREQKLELIQDLRNGDI